MISDQCFNSVNILNEFHIYLQCQCGRFKNVLLQAFSQKTSITNVSQGPILAGKNMLKVNKKTLEKGVKYVQSEQ